MSRSRVLPVSFFSLFARPASLAMIWALAMAVCGSLLQLDEIAWSMAFSGSAPTGTDGRLITETAHALVIHASAMLGAALGLIVLLGCSEVEASPRLAIAPGFYASVRIGSISVIVLALVLIWLWARRWASTDSLCLAVLWMPFWFAISFWDRSLLRAPRLVRALPPAVLLLVALRANDYVSIVSRMDWQVPALLLVPTVFSIRRRWSAELRTTWMEATNGGTRVSTFRDWLFDRSNRLELQIIPGTQRSVRWWNRYLRAARAENQRPSFSWATFYACFVVFVYVWGTTPLVLFMNLISLGAAVGQSLHHPISRIQRAQLQFLEQLRDIALMALITGIAYVLCDRIGLPRFSRASDFQVPFFVHLAAGIAMSPLTQLGRATIVPPVEQQSFNPGQLVKFILTYTLFMISTMTVMMSIWYASNRDAFVTMQWLVAVGIMMQVLCYFALRRYFATANLAPVPA